MDKVQQPGLFDRVKNEMMGALDKGFEMLESEQSKVNKALFNSLSSEQKGTFCRSLNDQGVPTKRIERITDRSTSSVKRYLNDK